MMECVLFFSKVDALIVSESIHFRRRTVFLQNTKFKQHLILQIRDKEGDNLEKKIVQTTEALDA